MKKRIMRMFRMAKWYSRDRKLDKRRTAKTFSKPFKKDQKESILSFKDLTKIKYS